MNFIEKYLKLRSIHPFDKLQSAVVAAIADVCFERVFSPSETVVSAGNLPTHFFVAFEGGIFSENGRCENLFSIKNLIEMSEYAENFKASKECGAHCLVMKREHFQTAVKNCPEILTLIAKGMLEKRKERKE